MKSCTKYFILLLICLHAVVVKAQQSQLTIPGTAGGRTPVLFDTTNYGLDIENTGLTDSEPYSIRVWASIKDIFTNSSFTDADIISDIDYGPQAGGTTIRRSYSHPTPLLSDNRLLVDIVGQPYYFRTCIIGVGNIEIECTNRAVNVVAPDASAPNALLGVSEQFTIIEYSAVTRNNEAPFDFLMVGWQDRALDGGPLAPEVFTEFPVDSLTPLQDDAEFKRYSIPFESTPGVAGSFTVRQCFNLAAQPNNPSCSAPGSVSSDIGYRRAVADATQGQRSDVIRVEWPRFAFAEGFDAYQITRCLAAPEASASQNSKSQKNCVVSRVSSVGPLERFDDTDALRGDLYTYTIDACIGTGVETCDPSVYPNIARATGAFIGLVDKYEDDDNPSQATEVVENETQIRSFDNRFDDDWIKISLSMPGRISIETLPFETELLDADTTLELFDSNQNSLIFNDDKDFDDNLFGFSKIETEILEPGDYFVLATHYEIPNLGFGAPLINNYILQVKFLNNKVNMAPIIQLLMSGEASDVEF